MTGSVALKGNIIFCGEDRQLICRNNAYLVAREGKVAGVYPLLPPEYARAPLRDYGGALIIPGLTDLHLHAPQYAFAGLGMDLELLPWLERCAFPEESRYADLDYAAAAYGRLVAALRKGFTTRLMIFATRHTPASLLLAELLHWSGLAAYVGRVSMDSRAPAVLKEGCAAAEEERRFIEALLERGFPRVRPAVTPRFIPSCSPELLWELGRLAQEYRLPVQSHLGENRGEIRLVGSLYPEAPHYASVYDSYGLLGQTPTVMAHCVHCLPEELRLLAQRGVFIAHCPQSNLNLMSGAAPIRAYLDQGQRVGLGTDVAGGAHLSLFRAIQDAVAVSKLRKALLKPEEQPLALAEAFYLATRGGGAFFGSTGAFEAGYDLDALVIDDGPVNTDDFTLEERLARAIYLLDENSLLAKYVEGEEILQRL